MHEQDRRELEQLRKMQQEQAEGGGGWGAGGPAWMDGSSQWVSGRPRRRCWLIVLQALLDNAPSVTAALGSSAAKAEITGRRPFPHD